MWLYSARVMRRTGAAPGVGLLQSRVGKGVVGASPGIGGSGVGVAAGGDVQSLQVTLPSQLAHKSAATHTV